MSFKKLALVGGVLAAILAAVLGFLLYSSSNQDFIEGKSDTVVIPTVNPSNSFRLLTHKEAGAEFQYPEESDVQTGTIDGGGEAVIIKPDIVVKPIIEIQITSANETPIDRVHAIFSAYGLQKQDVLMGEGNAISATLYTGAISLPNGDLQEEVVVFEKNGKVYKIQMSYTSDAASKEASQAFQAVISTFKI